MQYDVVVVGGGIGGLTVAALLAARGVSVCLLERNSNVGGCVSRVEFSGYDFEPGMGLYPEWGPGEIHDRIFSELPVDVPETRLVEDDYVVRIGNADVHLRRDPSQFSEELRLAFPECADSAVRFYELVDKTYAAAQTHSVDSVIKRVRNLFSASKDLTRAQNTTTAEHLKQTSERFQQFIDAQLRAFIQTPVDRCAFLPACHALRLPRQKLYSISGGPATVGERLAEAIKKSGGTVRLNSPVLRLAYNDAGDAVGVDLLSSERVIATRAIVSNMTIWDTYGKLVGLNRTPPEIKKLLATQTGNGVYMIYASMELSALKRLPAERFLVCITSSSEDDANSEITFATNGQSEQSAPEGELAVTLKTSASVNEWFAFQSSEEDFEEWDQKALERVWNQLHVAVPELGGDIEVIETANPRTFYDETRRKLGMVMGVEQSPESLSAFDDRTTLPNVFMVGDTVSSAGLATVSGTAEELANRLSR
ncbi:MAG TPA: FAD-dependent oxidoreductase [Pyrinomonadaceae bacterium]